MTVYQLFELSTYLCGKFAKGSALPPARFNQVLEQAVSQFYDSAWKEVVAARSVSQSTYDTVLSRTPLIPFKRSATLTAGSDGQSELPDDYYDYILAQTLYGGANNVGGARVRQIRIVNDEMFGRMQNDVTARPTVTPFGKIGNATITVVPYNIEDFTLLYFAKLTTPYMDYCSPSDNPTQVVFMPVGSYITSVNNVNYLYDANDNVLSSDVIKSMTALPYTSQTVELPFGSQHHHRLLWMITTMCGVNLSETEVVKYALMMQGQ